MEKRPLPFIIRSLNGEATLFHPWYLVAHGFVPWYGFKEHYQWYLVSHGFDPWYIPKEHCNNVIKRIHAFSIKHSRNFGILHLSYSIEVLSYWFWVLFLIWFERWGSKNPLWASPLHVTYLIFVSLCYSMHQMITIYRFTPLLSRHPSLPGLSPQDLDHWSVVPTSHPALGFPKIT